ncbi:MAG: ABC transporter ATP-binding protein [Alphaproteobacteria bacterium]
MLIWAIMAMFGTAASFWLLPRLIEAIVDNVLVAKDLSTMKLVLSGIVFVFVLRAVSIFAQRGLLSMVSLRALGNLQTDLSANTIRLDFGFFTKNSPGELIARQTTDTTTLRSVVEATILGLARDLPTLLGIFLYLLYKDWLWTISALLALPLIGIPVIITSRYIRGYARRAAGIGAQVTIAYDEAFHGIQAIKTNQAEGYESKRFGDKIGQSIRTMIKSAWIVASLPAIVEIIAMSGMVFVIWFGGQQVIEGSKTSGELVAYLSSLLILYDPLKRVIAINANVQIISASLSRVFELMDKQPSICDAPNAGELQNPKGDIEFKNVCFSYDADEPVLNNASFVVKAGQKIALVGPSGAGKTTSLLLVPRLFDLTSGEICIGGQSTSELKIDSLRNAIAYVTQDAILFDDTIRANLAFGKRDATDAQIEAAAKAAQAWDFIQDSLDGLETRIGPRGERLSGGQKQRLVIARAILRDAPILLLDEATSALDTNTETAVQSALDDLSTDRTTMVVAHRLSTVVNADKILVFQHGEIVEQGTHEELMQGGKIYPALVNSQIV